MGKLGAKHHLKRLNAPASWSIPRKNIKWVSKPNAGPHKEGNYLPLLLVVREMLGYAKTIREAKYILSNKMILVNGKSRSSFKFPVGLMDIIEIPEAKEYYRVLLAPNKGFVLHPIQKKEVNIKVGKIDGKTSVKKGNIQLNLHDGTNLLIKVNDPKKTNEIEYNVKDTLILNLSDNKIREHIPLKEGVYALTIAGKNLGYSGLIKKIDKRFGPFASTVTLSNEKIGVFQTALDYVFPIGISSPVISIPESD